MLKAGSKLIHVGQGEHLVPARTCSRALTVRADRWRDRRCLPQRTASARATRCGDAPNLIVTPHMASVASPETIGLQVALNVRRLRVNGEPLHNQVDVARGY